MFNKKHTCTHVHAKRSQVIIGIVAHPIDPYGRFARGAYALPAPTNVYS
jgi:hypothetical protein